MESFEHLSDEELLALIAERWPAWEVARTFGGWEAVPRGVRVLRAAYLSSLAERLASEPE
jgi:hypothetical protein